MDELQMTEHLPEITALSRELGKDAMIAWSEEKKKDFTVKFSERARVSQYIMALTAELVVQEAKAKQFISDKHLGGMQYRDTSSKLRDRREKPIITGSYYNESYFDTVGGRQTDELRKIAKDRADQILANLPELQAAVEIISPEISKAIEKRDSLLDQGKKLFKLAEEVSGSLNMADVDQKMSVGEFREFVKARHKKRRDLLYKMEEVGKEAQSLENKINRFLYAGLPGLSQAVMDVINNLFEKVTALGTLNRRVEEKVMFGDSAAAVTLLQSFEKDELAVSDEVKSQFDRALEALKVAGAKKVKALKKGK